MKVKGKEYELLDPDILSEIGAGKVVDFVPRNGDKIPVLVPKGTPREMVGLLAVSGDSLTGDGIYDGDVLAFRRNFKLKDVGPDTICAVLIQSTGDVIAKKVMIDHNSIVLRSSGGKHPDKHYEPGDLQIQGICYAAVRLADRFGRFSKEKHDEYDF